MKLSELNNLAKDNVIKLLIENGFKRQKMLYYTREVENGINFIVSFRLNYGENLKVDIACHTEEMNALLSENRVFPKDFYSMMSSELSPTAPIEYGTQFLWKVKNEDEAIEVLNEISKLMLEKVFPFFERMSNRSNFESYFPSTFRKWGGDYVDILDKIIANKD